MFKEITDTSHPDGKIKYKSIGGRWDRHHQSEHGRRRKEQARRTELGRRHRDVRQGKRSTYLSGPQPKAPPFGRDDRQRGQDHGTQGKYVDTQSTPFAAQLLWENS